MRVLPRALFLVVGLWVLALSAFAESTTRLPLAVELPAWPLHTQGRYIVDQAGRRFKLASVNWYGASDIQMVPGGLNEAPLSAIVDAIRLSGFNSVRLPFANAMLHSDAMVEASYVRANPQLMDKKPLEVFDAVVDALTAAGIAVIINNHTTHAMWCCTYDDDGLWYTEDYSEDRWLDDWAMLARRYQGNPGVVGVDLRNEVRIAKYRGTIAPNPPSWGEGPNDWRAAAERAGNRILAINPRLLIVVEGLNFPRYHLRGVYRDPVRLDVPDRLVYSAHNYGYIGPELIGQRYGDMDYAALSRRLDEEWGFVTKENQSYTAPVWLSEFGDDMSALLGVRGWFSHITRYLEQGDYDFAYWALNAGPKPSGDRESFAWLAPDWRTPLGDWRSATLKTLFTVRKGPGIEPGWEQDPVHRFEVLLVTDFDTNHHSNRDDWLLGSRKATCRDGARVVGLSGGEQAGFAFTHGVLCSDAARVLSEGPVTVVRSSRSDSGDTGPPPAGGDWSPGHHKVTCASDAYLSGVAQVHVASGYRFSGIRCTQAVGLKAEHCHGRSFTELDNRATEQPGDWDPLMRKGQCGIQEYAAGVSAKDGVVQGLLCCSL